ncbi:structural maintenance of chromosomes protein 1A-like [Impatiens glandulifera]|uniref:structural maintenance of chromosomes protein 1A-like n=1 Tax=Impatiens glandulifera TaxID=253017 RepID=UPI001FB13FAD|nr:structural maintenance of chromosomes protein 1A-like [Impatiens glandulifera]
MTSSEKVSALVGLKRTCVSKIKLINLAWNDLEENLDYSEKAFDEAIIDLRTREDGLNKTRKSIEESKEEVELLRKSVDSRLDKLLQREKQADDLDLKERVLNDRFKRLDEIQKLHEESGEANKIRGKELDSLEASFNRSLKEFHLKEKYFKLDKEMLDLQMKELGLKQEELEEKLKEIDRTRESVEHHAKEVEMERNRLHEQRRDLELKEQQLTSHITVEKVKENMTELANLDNSTTAEEELIALQTVIKCIVDRGHQLLFPVKPLMERVSKLLQKKTGEKKRPASFPDSNSESHRVKKDCSDVSIHETNNQIVAITLSKNSSDKSGS